MKVIKSSKYKGHRKVLCLEIREHSIDRYQIKIYVDPSCQQYVGEIDVEDYRIDEDHSEITLFGFGDLVLGTLKYRTIFDMDN